MKLYLFCPVSGTADGCPASLRTRGDHYLRVHGDVCYHFVLFHMRPYMEAKADCSQQGGGLALVKSRDVSDFLVHVLQVG